MPVVGDTWYAESRTPMYGAAEAIDRKKREEDFFNQTSMGGTGYNAMAAGAAEQAEQARVAAAEKEAAAKEAKRVYDEQMKASIATTRGATTEARGDLNPWREAGVDALGQLTDRISAGPGDYTESPGYQFRLDEGQKAIERSAAARGGVLSGRAVKEATRYSQNFATQDYDNFLRRYYDSLTPLERMSGQGQTAAAQMGAYSMGGAAEENVSRRAGAAGIAGTEMYGGEAGAEGVMNAANIMAAQRTAAAERDYGYDAWKKGEDF